jgi:hypothetical protein
LIPGQGIGNHRGAQIFAYTAYYQVSAIDRLMTITEQSSPHKRVNWGNFRKITIGGAVLSAVIGGIVG